jgi:hypothetical protein
MTVNTSGQIGVTALTPAGTYTITVKATDSTAGTALTGTITFTVVIDMTVTSSSVTTVTSADMSTTIATITAHGGSGTYTYTLDPSNTANAMDLTLTPSGSSVVITNNGAADTTPTMNVIVDVVDAGAPPAGEAVAPQASITIVVTIAN